MTIVHSSVDRYMNDYRQATMTAYPGHVLIRCRECGRKGTLSYVTREQRTLTSATTYVQILGCTAWRPVGFTRDDPLRWALTPDRPCPDCGSYRLAVNVVEGTWSRRKACGEHCLSAVGGKCVCSCGGENHGASHCSWGMGT